MAKTLVTGRETMTSRERVRAFFRREETDRVPIDMAWNPLIKKRVQDYFETEDLVAALGVDFKGVGAPYTGPVLHKPVYKRRVDPRYGWHTRLVEHGSGNYWDYCDFPLKDAAVEEILTWPFPDPAHYDYSQVSEQIDAHPDMAIHCGHPGIACIMNTVGFLIGMDQVFLDLGLENESFMILADRFMDHQYEVMKRTLEAGDGRIDFMWMGEDLGTQLGPFISMETFRRHILSRQKKFFTLAREFDVFTLLHTCGSSSWSYPDYMELGLTGVDTLQPEAADMSPRCLKDTFGGRLSFHGCISSTGALSFGTADDVEKDCIQTLEIMTPGGGYAFSPTHCLQDNTPLENVVRMYETVHRYGWY